MSKLDITFVESTGILDELKKKAYELSAQLGGRGFSLRMDVVNNKEVQNCNIFIEKLRID